MNHGERYCEETKQKVGEINWTGSVEKMNMTRHRAREEMSIGQSNCHLCLLLSLEASGATVKTDQATLWTSILRVPSGMYMEGQAFAQDTGGTVHDELPRK